MSGRLNGLPLSTLRSCWHSRRPEALSRGADLLRTAQPCYVATAPPQSEMNFLRSATDPVSFQGSWKCSRPSRIALQPISTDHPSSGRGPARPPPTRAEGADPRLPSHLAASGCRNRGVAHVDWEEVSFAVRNESADLRCGVVLKIDGFRSAEPIRMIQEQ